MMLPSLFSRIYGKAVGARNRYWDREDRPLRVDVPVVSVGNLTVGGTGKTPLTIWVAKRMLSRGERPAVVSRGYRGRAGRGPVVVSIGEDPLVSAAVSGDEPALLSLAVPGLVVVVGSDRVAGARKAIELGCDRIILDDGFQHRRLARDFDILVWDARESPLQARLLPCGRLREPLESARRADVVVFTHTDESTSGQGLWRDAFPLVPNFIARHRPTGLISDTPEEPPHQVLAFCGIASPQGFHHTLESMGIQVEELRTFRDHHNYSEADLRELAGHAKRAKLPLVTTEKDWARIRTRNLPQAPGWWRAPIEIEIDNARALERMLPGQGDLG